MHDVSRKPTQCKCNDENDEHFDGFPFMSYSLLGYRGRAKTGSFVFPQPSTNERVQCRNEYQRKKIEQQKYETEVNLKKGKILDLYNTIIGSVWAEFFVSVYDEIRAHKNQGAAPNKRITNFGIFNEGYALEQKHYAEEAIQRDESMCENGRGDGECKGILQDSACDITEYSRNPNILQIQEHHAIGHSKKGDHEVCYRHVSHQKVCSCSQARGLENDVNH